MANDNFQYGHDLVGFVQLESTYGVAVKPTSATAFRASNIAMAPVVSRVLPNDRRNTRSRQERTAGRSSATWGVSCLVRPSGSLGVAPDMGDLLTLIFGTETVNASTSVVYSLAKDNSGKMATIYRKTSDIHELVYGAVASDFTLNWNGGGYATIEVNGVAKGHTRTGSTQANGAGAGVDALVVDDLDFLGLYSIVSIGGDDNSGAGHQITAVNHATETATLEGVHTWSDNDTVVPFLPSPTLTGSPLYGTTGSVSFDGGSTNIKVVDGSISISTGHDLLNEEFGESSPADVVMGGMREVTFNLTLIVKKDETHLHSEFFRKVQKDLRITLGETAGSIVQIDMDTCEIDPVGIDIPEEGIQRVSVSGVALASASGEDEITMTWK